jgi:hypothetical protein
MLKIPVQVGWEEGVDFGPGEGRFALVWREEMHADWPGAQPSCSPSSRVAR